MTTSEFIFLEKNNKFYHIVGENKFKEYRMYSKDAILGLIFGEDRNHECESFKYSEVQLTEPSNSIII